MGQFEDIVKIVKEQQTCAHCYYWDGYHEGEGFHPCLNRKFQPGYYSSHNPPPNNAAWAQDMKEWVFLTGPEFGCVYWHEWIYE